MEDGGWSSSLVTVGSLMGLLCRLTFVSGVQDRITLLAQARVGIGATAVCTLRAGVKESGAVQLHHLPLHIRNMSSSAAGEGRQEAV